MARQRPWEPRVAGMAQLHFQVPVVANTTTLQNFSLAYFGASLPTFTVACLASSSPQALVSFLLKGSLSITV